MRLTSIFFAVATMALRSRFTRTVLNWGDLDPRADGLSGHSAGPAVRVRGVGLAGVVLRHCDVLPARALHRASGDAFVLRQRGAGGARGRGMRPVARPAHASAAGRRSTCCTRRSWARAGALYAHSNQFIGPDNFVMLESALVLTGIIVGGIGSLPGRGHRWRLIMVLLPGGTARDRQPARARLRPRPLPFHPVPAARPLQRSAGARAASAVTCRRAPGRGGERRHERASCLQSTASASTSPGPARGRRRELRGLVAASCWA